MNRDQVKELALANGFKLKEQPDGSMDLNPYVYEFAEALTDPLREGMSELRKERDQLKLEVKCLRPYKDNHNDLVRHMMEHDAQVIDCAIKSIGGYVTVSQVPHSQYAAGWNEVIKRLKDLNSLKDLANQLRQKAQEAE